MADYIPSDYAIKDTLAVTDPDRIITGSELQEEFDAIKTAVDSKIDAGFTPELDRPDLRPQFLVKPLSGDSIELPKKTADSASASGAQVTGDNFSIDIIPRTPTSKFVVSFNFTVSSERFAVGRINTTDDFLVLVPDVALNAKMNLRYECKIINRSNDTIFTFGLQVPTVNEETTGGFSDSVSLRDIFQQTVYFFSDSSLEEIAGESPAGYRLQLFVNRSGTFYLEDTSTEDHSLDPIGSITVKEVIE